MMEAESLDGRHENGLFNLDLENYLAPVGLFLISRVSWQE